MSSVPDIGQLKMLFIGAPCKAWEDMKSVTLKKSWRKEFPLSVAVNSESECDMENSTFVISF